MSADHSTAEIWKAVPSWLGYEASNLGRIRSWWRRKPTFRDNKLEIGREPRLIRISRTGTGYLKCQLRRGGEVRVALVHRVVLETFVGPCPAGMEACHNNGDRTDNRSENLRWGSRESNVADRLRHGKQPRGSDHKMCKLAEADIARLRSLKGTQTQRELARLFGISQSQVGRILRGDSWNHVNR